MTMTLPLAPEPHHPGSPSPSGTDRSPRPRGVRRVLLETAYNLSAFPLALVAFVLVVTDLALGLGLSILVGGVLLLSVGVLVARGVARFERIRMRAMLGRDAASPAYLCPRAHDSFWRKALVPLRDPQSWLDVVWSVVGLFTAVVVFVVTLAWWVGAGVGLTYWFWHRFLPEEDNEGLGQVLGLGDSTTADSVVNLLVGVFFALTLPWMVRAMAAMHAGLAWLLVSARADLQGEVARVVDGRDAARRAEADALRRLERDIHDGPQQRLVRLTMDISRAKRQVASDPERAGQVLDQALEQARATVAELRSLSRGIAPPLLVDRGLAVALEEMTNHAAVPVTVRVDLPDALPPHVETAVYFVVSEALTNIAKHADATHAQLEVGVEHGEVRVSIRDDGRGGAQLSKGHGLTGLAQRLAAVDGALQVDSPLGGPTVLAARVPLREVR